MVGISTLLFTQIIAGINLNMAAVEVVLSRSRLKMRTQQ